MKTYRCKVGGDLYLLVDVWAEGFSQAATKAIELARPSQLCFGRVHVSCDGEEHDFHFTASNRPKISLRWERPQ